jgi:predicted nucleic acid-binding protein
VLGLFRKAKILGIIPALSPYVEHLLNAGAHYSPELVTAILRDSGEA